MSYALIGDLKKKAVTVIHACRVLGVSRSGYYSAAKSSPIAPKVCATSVHLKTALAPVGAPMAAAGCALHCNRRA